MRMKRKILVGLFVSLLVLYGCVTNPVTGRTELGLVSEQQEIAIGTQNYPYQQQMQGGVVRVDPELNRYVEEVGQKLARVSDRPHLPYEFVVLNDGTWNAWAMPGGKIGINRGLLLALRNESELAAVLGHEIVHAAARHSAQQMQRGMLMQVGVAGASGLAGDEYRNVVTTASGVAAGLGMLRYSRAAEEEADYYGILYMIRAGYDPVGAVTLQELFAENRGSAGGWLASHPASLQRVRNNRATLERHHADGSGYLGEAEYRARTRGLRERQPAYDLYEQGLKALANQQPREALQLSREARRLAPEEALFYGLSARAHQDLNQPREAMAAWNEAIQRNPDWYYFYLQRGLLHEKSGNRTQAKNDLTRSFELLPTQTAKDALDRLES